PAGSECVQGSAQQLCLKRDELSDIGRRLAPAGLWSTTERAESGAWSVDEDPIEAVRVGGGEFAPVLLVHDDLAWHGLQRSPDQACSGGDDLVGFECHVVLPCDGGEKRSLAAGPRAQVEPLLPRADRGCS